MSKNDSLKNLIIFENKNFDIHQDWSIPIPGFFIIEAKGKIKSFIDFSNEESYELMDLLRNTIKIMKEKLNIEDVYIFQNEDTKHGFHIWIFPRLNWMEKFGKKIQSVRPIMSYAKENMFFEENVIEIKKYVKIMRENFTK